MNASEVTVPGRSYFAETARRIGSPERLEMARRTGRKVVALVGVHVPEPLFWACGAVPIAVSRLVGPTNRDLGLPRDTCAAARMGYDLLANHWIPAGLIDAVVLAGGCDWIARLADHLGDRIPVWPLHVSRASACNLGAANPLASRLASLEAMLTELERLTDLPLTSRAFSRECERAGALDVLCEQLDRLRADSPPALSATEYYQIVGALDLADPDRWAAEVETLLAQQNTGAVQGQEARGERQEAKLETDPPRILLCGSPTGFPDSSLVELIEASGLQIVGDGYNPHRRATSLSGGFCSGSSRTRNQQLATRNSKLETQNSKLETQNSKLSLHWLAERLVTEECVGAEDVQGPMAEQAAARKAEGVVWVHYRGCAVGAMEAARLPGAELPLLTLEIEQFPPPFEALRTRLQAFREQLLAHKPVVRPCAWCSDQIALTSS